MARPASYRMLRRYPIKPVFLNHSTSKKDQVMAPAKTREGRLTVSLNNEEIEAIENWRFEHRLPSRAAAVRELIGRGITSQAPEDTPGKVASRDIGVVASAIARASNECFVITNPHLEDNPIVYASPGFVKTTGYSEDEIIGRNCRFLQGAETSRSTVAEIKENIADERVMETKILNYRKDGTPIMFHLEIQPVPDPESGALLFFIGRQFLIE